MSFLSVVIPTKDRKKNLANLLWDLSVQSCKPDEVIIVDSSEIENIRPLITKYSTSLKIKHFHDPMLGTARARNLGIKEASGTWVLFLDDDVRISRNFLKNLVRILTTFKNVACFAPINSEIISRWSPLGIIKLFLHNLFFIDSVVGGKVLPSFFNSTIPISSRFIEWAPTRALCCKREVVLKYMFDEHYEQIMKYAICEDLDLTYRISREYKLLVVPILCVRSSIIKRVSIPSKLRERISTARIFNHCYFMYKMKPRLVNKLLFFWAFIGIIIFALFKKDFPTARGAVAGLALAFKRKLI